MAHLMRNCINLLKTSMGRHIPTYFRGLCSHSHVSDTDLQLSFKSIARNSDECQRYSLNDKACYTVRKMTKSDLPFVLQMLDEEKWIMEKAYLQCAIEIDPGGFYVLTAKDDTIIGFRGVYSTCKRIYYSCLWIVKKEVRHMGIGKLLLMEMERKVVFDGNEARFVWAHLQQETVTEGFPFKSYMTWYNYGNLKQSISSKHRDQDFDILHMDDKLLDKLIEYGTKIHAMIRRDQYITTWLKHKLSKTLIATRNGSVVGYGVLRSQDHYNQIAPLYADSEVIATALFERLTSYLPEKQKVGISCPIDNSAAMALAKRNGLVKPGYPLVLMFTKYIVHIDTSKVYAVSSNSFGLY